VSSCEKINYLGYIIRENGVKPDPQKIQVVKEFPRPQNSKNIKQFLGFATTGSTSLKLLKF